MTTIVLVPAAETDWRAQDRLMGDTDLPLNAKGRKQAADDGDGLRDAGAVGVYAGEEEPTAETGEIVGDALEIGVTVLKELREIDLGHWEGLTETDFKERFGKARRRWRSDPLSIAPPDGESVAVVAQRLAVGGEKILTKHPDQTVIVVLGRFAYAALQSLVANDAYAGFWGAVDAERDRRILEVDPHVGWPVPAEDDGAGASKPPSG